MGSSVGYSVPIKEPTFVDLPASLDEAEGYPIDSIEIPLLTMNVIANTRVLEAELQRLVGMCSGRTLTYSVHAAIGLNFADVAWRLPLHLAVAKSSVDVTKALAAGHMVLHSGKLPLSEAAEMNAAYARQRDCLKDLGDYAAARGVKIFVESIAIFDEKYHVPLPSRLAEEIALIDHPNIAATLDVSHAYLACGIAGADFLQEVEALAPFAHHVHLHDSFGKPRRMFCCTESEALAFGVGDLHLPLGLGSVPWDDVMDRCVFPDGVMLNLELKPVFWPHLGDSIARARHLQSKLRHPSTMDPAA